MTFNPHEVVTRFAPALARIVATYERDPALRDELLQEVFMAILISLPRLEQQDRLRAFVFRIAHNRSVSHVSLRVRERAHSESLADFEAPLASQEQALIQAERGERLLEAVRRLALPYRQVMTLILEDMSYDEIADALGISVTNVGIRVNRAKKRLKELLDHE